MEAEEYLQDDHNIEVPENRYGTFAKIAIGTIVMGAIGSGLWDLLAKPGLSKAGRLFLTIITLGSEKFRDWSYSTAATDPYPFASLLLLFLITFLPFFFAIHVWLDTFKKPQFKDRIKKRISKLNKEGISEFLEIEYAKAAKKHKRSAVTLIVSLLLTYIIFLSGYILLNQSILISRAFYADITICAPYMTDQEEEILKSKFTMMKTRDESLKIFSDLSGIAKSNNIKLVDIELW